MFKTGASILLSIASLLATGAAWGLEVSSFTLDNGLQVIAAREPKAPVVVSQLWYRVGAADEVAGKTGIAHMLEHMMFKGTKEVADGEFSKIIARNGGTDNAFTSHDFTAYYIKFSSDRIDLALQLEADRMHGLILAEDDFKAENDVVREERRTRIDNDPNQRLLEAFRALSYGSHPYGRAVIGLMQDVENHTLADLEDWYRRYYAPNNAILILVGDVDLEGLRPMVERHFGHLKASANLPARQWPEPVPVDGPKWLLMTDERAKLPLCVVNFPAPSLSTSDDPRDPFALDVLVTILGDGHASRLHQSLVIKGKLAASVGASYGMSSRDQTRFGLSALPKADVDVEAVEKALLAEVLRLTREPVSQRELDRAKNTLIADHVYGLDSAYQMAMTLGDLAVSGADWRVLVDYPDKVRAVTIADVQRVAKRYLGEEHMVVGILLPEDKDEGEATGQEEEK